jgi:hypothetical protein
MGYQHRLRTAFTFKTLARLLSKSKEISLIPEIYSRSENNLRRAAPPTLSNPISGRANLPVRPDIISHHTRPNIIVSFPCAAQIRK